MLAKLGIRLSTEHDPAWVDFHIMQYTSANLSIGNPQMFPNMLFLLISSIPNRQTFRKLLTKFMESSTYRARSKSAISCAPAVCQILPISQTLSHSWSLVKQRSDVVKGVTGQKTHLKWLKSGWNKASIKIWFWKYYIDTDTDTTDRWLWNFHPS